MMHGVTLWKLAPGQRLGRSVGYKVPVLVVTRLAAPRRVDYHGARLSAICSACPALIPPEAKSDRTEKVKSKSGM